MEHTPFKRVLITGTTSGLGRAFLIHYAKLEAEVIAINRRHCTELEDWGIHQQTVDIADYDSVLSFLVRLKEENRVPDLFILNAGINQIDNVEGLDYKTYSDIMRTNLDGVMTFVGAIHALGITGTTISAISSTSNIIPNPSHVAYYLSKLAINESFKLIRKKDDSNQYKTIVLGPVHTGITRQYGKPKGLQGMVFDLLAVQPDQVVEKAAFFFEGQNNTLHYTLASCLFYWGMRWLIKRVPGLYKGTTASPRALTPAETTSQA